MRPPSSTEPWVLATAALVFLARRTTLTLSLGLRRAQKALEGALSPSPRGWEAMRRDVIDALGPRSISTPRAAAH